jgi:hypothetical protein
MAGSGMQQARKPVRSLERGPVKRRETEDRMPRDRWNGLERKLSLTLSGHGERAGELVEGPYRGAIHGLDQIP